MDIEQIESLVLISTISIGFLPLIIACMYEKYTFCFICICCILIGYFSASKSSLPIAFNSNITSDAIVNVSVSVSSVFYALICMIYLRAITIVSSLRTLWIIVIITSSCTFTDLQNYVPLEVLPNDITVYMLVIGVLLLLLTACISKLCYKKKEEINKKVIIVEFLFVIGAFAIRFEDYIKKYLTLDIGNCIWYLMSWINGVIMLNIITQESA